MRRRGWTREELIVAFNLYCKIPFGRIHIRNPLIIQLAQSLGRTPSAVSWKLANFARLDPALKRRNVKGAAHGARAEVEISMEFNDDWEGLAFESERLWATWGYGRRLTRGRGVPRRPYARGAGPHTRKSRVFPFSRVSLIRSPMLHHGPLARATTKCESYCAMDG